MLLVLTLVPIRNRGIPAGHSCTPKRSALVAIVVGRLPFAAHASDFTGKPEAY